MPPKDWGVGAHTRHLRNLYVYFWRWATWKVFDQPKDDAGIVCFITVAGFLNGPGFQKMRDYLRRTCDDVWVIDCSPEGHQPEVATRIFQGVQHPVCIVLASRSPKVKMDEPGRVHFQSLPRSHREAKFDALAKMRLDSHDWLECPTDWRAPFLPASGGEWATFPSLEDLFTYDGTGVMSGRTWIVAPDAESLKRRWKRLVDAPIDQKEILFHPHLRNGDLGDKHSRRIVPKGLAGFSPSSKCVADEDGECLEPVPFNFRSFDRQWIIPDARVINQPNPALWDVRSDRQVYLTAPADRSPTDGPALTVCAAIPDVHHYNGRGGRVFPVWSDGQAKTSNVPPKLLAFLSQRYGKKVEAEELAAYIVAVAAHPAYTDRFQADLSTPGLRIPFTADTKRFAEAAELGRTVVWLHTFGERMADPNKGRPKKPPRLPQDRQPKIPKGGAIPQTPAQMPDDIEYDAGAKLLRVGAGCIEGVTPPVWGYRVSGKQVVLHWFSYRKANRERPIIGDRRPPSPLGEIQPDHWLPEYTTELLNLLNVLGLLVELEPAQAALLEAICDGPTIPLEDFQAAGAFDGPAPPKRNTKNLQAPTMFPDDEDAGG